MSDKGTKLRQPVIGFHLPDFDEHRRTIYRELTCRGYITELPTTPSLIPIVLEGGYASNKELRKMFDLVVKNAVLIPIAAQLGGIAFNGNEQGEKPEVLSYEVEGHSLRDMTAAVIHACRQQHLRVRVDQLAIKLLKNFHPFGLVDARRIIPQIESIPKTVAIERIALFVPRDEGVWELCGSHSFKA